MLRHNDCLAQKKVIFGKIYMKACHASFIDLWCDLKSIFGHIKRTDSGNMRGIMERMIGNYIDDDNFGMDSNFRCG